jgi:hypothetical protein
MSAVKGYRRKPIWIYVVASLFVLSPFIHLMGTLKGAGEPQWYSPRMWWVWVGHLDPAPALISFILCAAGLAILFVRRWSWWLGMTALSILCLYNIALITLTFANDPFTQLLATVGSLLLLTLLFFSEFKQPYFNQRLRWWESEPRFHVSLPVSVHPALETAHAATTKAQLVDISKSGLYLEAPTGQKALELPEEIVVEVNSELRLPCRFSRATEHGGSAYQFLKISRHQSRYLRRWIQLLAKDPDRRVR